MGKFRIQYLPAAEKDLIEIVEYIKADKPSAATDFLEQLDRSVSKLTDFPFMGPVAKDERLKNMGYRLLVIGNYIVFYVVKDKTVQIRRVLYGRRKYEFLL